MLFELDQDAADAPALPHQHLHAIMAEYPMTDYDISVLLDGEVKWADVAARPSAACKNDGLLHGRRPSWTSTAASRCRRARSP